MFLNLASIVAIYAVAGLLFFIVLYNTPDATAELLEQATPHPPSPCGALEEESLEEIEHA